MQWLAAIVHALWTHTVQPVLRAAPAWLRYLYFLRFSILLWLFPVVLVAANSPSVARSLVSGIITPVTPLQYVCASFFLISASLVALILAHVVVINGPERFNDDPPPLLVRLLDNPNSRWEWFTLAASQLNNLVVFWYFFSNGTVEQVERRFILWGLGGGILLSALFWYALSAFYYLIYDPGPGAGVNAKTLIFPRSLMLLSAPGGARRLEMCSRLRPCPFPSIGWPGSVPRSDTNGRRPCSERTERP